MSIRRLKKILPYITMMKMELLQCIKNLLLIGGEKEMKLTIIWSFWWKKWIKNLYQGMIIILQS